MILLLDNYDSFTYNIKQYLEQLAGNVVVYKNDAISVAQIEQLQPKAIVLGPGPGTPDEAGITLSCIQHFANKANNVPMNKAPMKKVPMLGVCLGHQAIAQAFGANIVRAQKVMHGRISPITHNQRGLFLGMDNPTQFTRYHSLLIDNNTLPDSLEITAWTGTPPIASQPHHKHMAKQNPTQHQPTEIMAIRHKNLPIAGVQFHPESILSHAGLKLFDNFLNAYDLH